MKRLKSFHAAVDLARSRLQGEDRRKQLAALATQTIAEVNARNRAAFGHDVGRKIIVDGREGASIDSVKLGGQVVGLYAVHEAAIDFTWMTIARLSPVDMRPDADEIRYRESHLLLVNGQDAGLPPVTIEVDDVVTFVNLLAYARRIEKGWSKKQAPDGVYEVAATIIRARFGNIVNVKFGYGSFMGATASRDTRYPYIELSPKRSRR